MTAAVGHRAYARLTAPQIKADLNERTILCLPLGSLEQHGPHLPLNTDTVLAERFAHRLAQHFADRHDLWVAPPLPYGLSAEHAWSSGTVTFDVPIYAMLIETLVTEYLRSAPLRRVLIVNGHGGNRGVLDVLVQQLRHRHGAVVCAVHLGSLTAGQARREPGVPEIHAGVVETALMLALAPDHVRLDLLLGGIVSHPDQCEEVRRLILSREASWPWSSGDPALAVDGIIGSDPRGADDALGQSLLSSALRACGAVLDRLAPPDAHTPAEQEKGTCV